MTAVIAVRFVQTAASAPPNAPQRIFPGFVQSTSLLVGWWPPTSWPTIVPDNYNIYRGGVQVGKGYHPLPLSDFRATPQMYFVDVGADLSPPGLAPSTTYTYTVRAVINGIESTDSPALMMTTLAGPTSVGSPSTLPTPPTPWTPDAYSLPVGGTTWTCTNTADNSSTGTTGTGTLGQVGCSFGWALSHAQLGDVIFLTAGASGIYPSGSNGGWQIPVFPGTPGNYVYIISSAFASLPAPGVRVGRAHLPLMPTIQLTQVNGGVGATIAAGASYIRFVGINFGPAPSNRLNQLVSCLRFTQASFGHDPVPADHVSVDRCFFGDVSDDPTDQTYSWIRNGVGINCNFFNMDSCYGTGLYDTVNADSWAVSVQGGGPGIVNNSFFEVTSESFITGGQYISENYIPHDWIISNNDSSKSLAWLWAANGTINDGTAASPPVAGNIMTVTASVPNFPLTVIPGHSITGPAAGTYIVKQLTGPAGGIGQYQVATPSGAPQVFTGLMFSGLQNEVKNHFEMKVGQRFAFHDNTVTNCWAGSIGGQKGRAFVITCRDQQASPVLRIFTGYIVGNTLTVVTAAAPTGQVFPGESICGNTGVVVNGSTAVAAAITGVGGTGTYTVNPAQTVGSAAAPVSMVASSDIRQTCPWNLVEDVDVYNNWMKNANSLGYAGFTADYSATARCRRIRFKNNIGFINPPLGRTHTPFIAGVDQPGDQSEVFWSNGPSADVTLDHNMVINNPAALGTTNNGFVSGIFQNQNNWNGRAPFPSAAQQGDRWTITNNVFDGSHGVSSTISAGGGNNFTDGLAGFAAAFSNSIWSNNVLVTANFNFNGTSGNVSGANNTAAVGYPALHMANFVNNATAFVNPSDWNITSGTFFTSSTTNGPVGSIF